MENFITSIPNTFYGWLITLIAGMVSIIVGVSIIRRNDLKILRENNADLTARVDLLEKEVVMLKEENTRLDGDYKDLKFKKNYLKQIVIEALATKKDINESILKEINTEVILGNKK